MLKSKLFILFLLFASVGYSQQTIQECEQEKDSLFSLIHTYQGIVNNLRSSNIDLHNANNSASLLLVDKQKELALDDLQIKKSNRRINLLRIERTVGWVAVGVLALKIFLTK